MNLPCKRLQVDEIWEFCYAKAKNVPADKKGVFGYGDVWTFVAIDADTKLVPSWLVGARDIGSATELMQDLVGRLVDRVQLTTDGLKAYSRRVEDAFGGDVDYAQLHKIYADAPSGPETRYSPAECTGCEKRVIYRQPGREARLHVLRRAPEPHDADEHAAVHPADERPQQEGREPRRRDRRPLRLLQLLPGAHEPGEGENGKGRTPAMAAGVESRKLRNRGPDRLACPTQKISRGQNEPVPTV